MASSLSTVPPLSVIGLRLQLVFPEGVDHRNYVIRDMAARTLYVMFYVDAIEGSGRWIRPSMVTDMTDKTAKDTKESTRLAWYDMMLSSKKAHSGERWYAPNSREPIRDETIRVGLIPNGAIIERALPTSSGLPRYALAKDFAALFGKALVGTSLTAAIAAWQAAHLSSAAKARLQVLKAGVTRSGSHVLVKYPNGTTHRLAPGPSSIIAKAVIEEFAPTFLKDPAVLWFSDSASKVRVADAELAGSLGLHIDPSRLLPDIILVDVGAGTQALFVFVEVVATDGPVSEHRKSELLRLAATAGIDSKRVLFVTAYDHRGGGSFVKTVANLAVPSFAWFRAEPSHLFINRDRPGHLPDLA